MPSYSQARRRTLPAWPSKVKTDRSRPRRTPYTPGECYASAAAPSRPAPPNPPGVTRTDRLARPARTGREPEIGTWLAGLPGNRRGRPSGPSPSPDAARGVVQRRRCCAFGTNPGQRGQLRRESTRADRSVRPDHFGRVGRIELVSWCSRRSRSPPGGPLRRSPRRTSSRRRSPRSPPWSTSRPSPPRSAPPGCCGIGPCRYQPG